MRGRAESEHERESKKSACASARSSRRSWYAAVDVRKEARHASVLNAGQERARAYRERAAHMRPRQPDGRASARKGLVAQVLRATHRDRADMRGEKVDSVPRERERETLSRYSWGDGSLTCPPRRLEYISRGFGIATGQRWWYIQCHVAREREKEGGSGEVDFSVLLLRSVGWSIGGGERTRGECERDDRYINAVFIGRHKYRRVLWSCERIVQSV